MLSRGARPEKAGWLDVMPLFGNVEESYKVFRRALPVGPARMSDLAAAGQKMVKHFEARYLGIQEDSSHAFHIVKRVLSPYVVDHRGMTALEGAWRAHQVPILVALLEEGVGGLQEQIDKIKVDLQRINSAKNATAINQIIGADPVLGPILNPRPPKCDDDGLTFYVSEECLTAGRKYKAERTRRLLEGAIEGDTTTPQALAMFYVLSRNMSLEALTRAQRQRLVPIAPR